MAEQAGEKNFDPTPHRRQQARLEGHVAKSGDLCSAGMLLLGLTILMMLGGGLVNFLIEYCREQLGGTAWLTADPDFTVHHAMVVLWGLGWYLLPIFGLLMLAGVAVHVVQTGFLFLPQKLTMDPARINPVQGLQRIYSLQNMIRLGFGILKTVVICVVAGVVIYGQRVAIIGLTQRTMPELAVQMTQILLWTTLKIGAALLVLAVIDYAFQWWKHEQDLKMTPQEMQEELRNLEGNPQLISRRKQMQRNRGESRQTSETSLADVLLIDSTGLVVAVRYDPDTMSAPTIIAKGAGLVGKRMLDSAEQRHVAVVENPSLTQQLYRSAGVQQPVSAEHYTAVAEVLTQVYEREEQALASSKESPVGH
jgi:flagellar biosynthetic protein FlhB